MLSVQEMEEDNELEEGEACCNKDDSSIVPDKSFSYIEEKVHSLLGHHVRDFDFEISPSNLGALYGEYGSFLPMYQRSLSVWPQKKTPQRVQTYITTCSPLEMNTEGVTHQLSIPSDVPVSLRSGTASHSKNLLVNPKVASADVSATRDTCMLPHQITEKLPLKHNSLANNLVNLSDQQSLKVRIKVGPVNKAKKNAAIYSGLCLTSPLSADYIPDQSGGVPMGSSGMPCESPGSILQIMTSFPIPGSLLLSPLHESMLCLMKKETLPVERMFVLPIEGWQKNSFMFEYDSASKSWDGAVLKGKKKKSGNKGETPDILKYGNAVESKENLTSHLKESNAEDTIQGKQRLLNSLKIKLPSNSIAGNTLYNSVKSPVAYGEAGKSTHIKKRENEKNRARDRLLATDMPRRESLSSAFGQDCSKYDQLDTNSSLMEHINEQQPRNTCKVSSAVRSKDGGRTKDSRAPSFSKADSYVSKVVKEILPFVGKEMSKVNGRSGGNLTEKRESSVVQTSKKYKKAALKVIQKVQNSCKDVPNIGSDSTRSQMKLSPGPTGDKEVSKVEVIKQKETMNEGTSAEALPLEKTPSPDVSLLQDCDSWVMCDSCKKWRSLPWEIKADQLPEKWHCTMLYWLPGMNRCDISEDDTTIAVNLLNSQNHADKSRVTSADFQQSYQNNQDFITEAMPNHGRKKHKPKPANSSFDLVQASKLTKICREESGKSISLNDVNQHFIVTNLKGGNSANPLVPCNLGMEKSARKQNEKHVNEGDMKRRKLKTKRESAQYDHETLKKTKTEVAPSANVNGASEHDGDFGMVDRSGFPSRSVGEDMPEYIKQCHSKNGNNGPKDRLVISMKKQRDNTQISLKSESLDGKTCDPHEVHAKKRKLRDWQNSQTYVETSRTDGDHFPDGNLHPEEEISDQLFRKQKKSCADTKGSIRSIADGRSYKNSAVTKIILSLNRENSVHNVREKNQQQSKHRDKITPEIKLLPERFPTAATLCSSKVLDSRKTAGFNDVRGSLIESVSSSPMKLFSIDKLSPSRKVVSVKDDSRCGDSIIKTAINSTVREANVDTPQSGAERNIEASRNVLNYHDTDARQNSGGKSELRDRHKSRSGRHLASNVAETVIGQRESCTDIHVSDNCSIEGKIKTKDKPDGAVFPKKSGKESFSHLKDKNRSSNLQRVKVKVSDPLSERDVTKKIHMKVDIEYHGLDLYPEKSTDAKNQFSNQSGIKSNKDYKSAGEEGYVILASDCRSEKPTEFRKHNVSEAKVDDVSSEERGAALRQNVIKGFGIEIPEEDILNMVESTRGKLEINPCLIGKVNNSAHVRQPLSSSREGRGLDVHPSDGPGDRDVSNVLKRPGVHHNVGNFAPNFSVVRDLGLPCAVKEDISGQAAKNALKEAEAAKDLADRVKESGFDFGYNDAYFEAALKFLHCASLFEASSSDGRRVEMDQMQVYSIAAKLCGTCAQEFEKQKEMAAAALAYKCMEVSYLKLVCCKNSSSTRDLHDLEASLKMIPQGESPSSSASDIDNMNNHAAVDKAALSRGNAHAGNHVIVARTRPNFMRLLDFTNDVNSAMEASRKAQDAFTAANLEESRNKEDIALVKKVIQFSFQNVDELVKLVLQASKVISRPG